MAVPGRTESDTRHDDHEFSRFREQRRRRQARERRRRIVVVVAAVGALVAGSAAVVTVIRLAREAAPRAPVSVATAPVPVSTPRLDRPSRSPVTVPQPDATAAEREAPSPGSPSASAIGTDREKPSSPTPPGSLPPASPPPRPRVVTPGPIEEPPSSGDPARRTAAWLVQTYGGLEAENRAAVVAEFYSGEERAFWQRVLGEVRSIPAR